MKRFYLCVLLIAFHIAVSAQLKAGFSYSFSLPRQEMQENIGAANSIHLFFTSPFKKISKLSWGMETGIGQYAFFSKKQDIRFPDGSGINADVNYSAVLPQLVC